MHYGSAFVGDKILYQERVETMSIEKKSLISTLKTTKKANVASGAAKEGGSSVRAGGMDKHRAGGMDKSRAGALNKQQ
jgi:hypothetical protein